MKTIPGAGAVGGAEGDDQVTARADDRIARGEDGRGGDGATGVGAPEQRALLAIEGVDELVEAAEEDAIGQDERGGADFSAGGEAPERAAGGGVAGMAAAVGGTDVEDAVGEDGRGRLVIVIVGRLVGGELTGDRAAPEVGLPAFATGGRVEREEQAGVVDEIDNLVRDEGLAEDRAGGGVGPGGGAVGETDGVDGAVGGADADEVAG